MSLCTSHLPTLMPILRTGTLLIALGVLSQSVAAETAVATLAARAIHDATTGSPVAAGELEAAMEMATTPDPELESRYWQVIGTSQDYPRAYQFFSTMVKEHPHQAEALANAGSASGAYIGWLFAHGLGANTGALHSEADIDFASALALDPDNFSAHFGHLIAESYRPGGIDACRAEYATLLRLRARHPDYAWNALDAWVAGHPEVMPKPQPAP